MLARLHGTTSISTGITSHLRCNQRTDPQSIVGPTTFNSRKRGVYTENPVWSADCQATLTGREAILRIPVSTSFVPTAERSRNP